MLPQRFTSLIGRRVAVSSVASFKFPSPIPSSTPFRLFSTMALSSTRSVSALNMSSVSSAPASEAAKVTYDDFQITDACIKHMHTILKQQGPGVVLRLLVDTGGCSGYQYLFNLEQASPPNKYMTSDWDGVSTRVFVDGEDYVFQRDGVTVLVDDVSLPFVKGSKMDYKSEMIRSSFAVVDNPNVDLACGCGTSFAKRG